MKIKEIILNGLLDKYEKSKSYNENTNRRILIKFKDIKEYDIENYENKILWHEIVKDLKSKALVDFSWEKFNENNILNEIWLNKENVSKAYKEINRNNPKENYIEISKYLEKIKFNEPWLQEFSKDILNNMETKEKESAFLPFDKYKDILKALKEIDNRQKNVQVEEILKRTFSIKCYNDSKYFERNIEKNIVKILKKYYLKEEIISSEEEISDDKVLAEVGIIKYPEVIEFCGNMECQIENKIICFSDTTKGSYINSYAIPEIKNIKLINTSKVIFIENKTNYIDYISKKQKDELVIYHGGFYSKIKGEFFKKVFENNKNIKYYHWSDIDIGGIMIFTRLKENIIPSLKQFKMDKETLIENKLKCSNFDDKYKNKLIELRKNEKYKEFYDLMDFMIENNVRLEQEALI